ncbi:hypothetical protein FQR65_LT01825 [Abscondita terminalis]|nr:hypothetical protein FQR65_LT01825 [Abscondita terminalis]
MKLTVAVIAFFCVGAIIAHPKDEEVENCISSTGVDKKNVWEFMKGSKDDCEGIEACLKCIVDAKGIVQNGAVNVSSLEKFIKDNADAQKQLSTCQGMSASDICGLSKCLRDFMKIVFPRKKKD